MQRNAQSAICASTRYSSVFSTFRRVPIRTQARRPHALTSSGVPSLSIRPVLSQCGGSSATTTLQADLVLGSLCDFKIHTDIPSSCATLKIADQSYLLWSPRLLHTQHAPATLLLCLCCPCTRHRLIGDSQYWYTSIALLLSQEYSMLCNQQQGQAKSHMQVSVRRRSHFNGIDAQNILLAQYWVSQFATSRNRYFVREPYWICV